MRNNSDAERMYEEMDDKIESRIKKKYGIEDKEDVMKILQISTPYEMIGNGW